MSKNLNDKKTFCGYTSQNINMVIAGLKNKLKNKIQNGIIKHIQYNGGLENFNIIELETIDCDKEEITIHKSYYEFEIMNFYNIVELLK
jgi:hypothetical protein